MSEKEHEDSIGAVPMPFRVQAELSLAWYRVMRVPGGEDMAKKAKKQTARGRKQDRARVAGGQDYEVRYEAKKTRRSAPQAADAGYPKSR